MLLYSLEAIVTKTHISLISFALNPWHHRSLAHFSVLMSGKTINFGVLFNFDLLKLRFKVFFLDLTKVNSKWKQILVSQRTSMFSDQGHSSIK